MSKRSLYPEIEPFRTGTLAVSDLHTVFFEEVGNPKGKPALFLHGGPGVGILPGYRQFFDPAYYRIILLDQRGAGRSTPSAELAENTTWDLVTDLEALRDHLEVEQWVVMGGSWGSTLALAYAVTHPASVLGLIIRGVFLARPAEIRWLHSEGGAANIFPDEWERYVAPIAQDRRDDVVRAYYERLTGGDEASMMAAARAWSRWEASIMTLLPDPEALEEMTSDASAALSIARIECHYTVNDFFMRSDNDLLDHAPTLGDMPCRIVQGRYDVICPMISAWHLHHALPGSEMRIVSDGSHSPMEAGMVHELVGASEDFKSLY